MLNINLTSKGRAHHAVRPTKLQKTCGQIEDLAQSLGPDAKLPTVIELRDMFGVSIATLNSALTELEAQRVIRRKHGVGIYVSPRIRQRTVCLICDPSFFRVSGASPFWNLLIDQVRRRAEAEREAFSFHFTADDPEVAHKEAVTSPLQSGLMNDIVNGRVDGILSVGILEPTMQWIEKYSVPIVAFAGPGRFRVGINSNEIIRLGVKALADSGCKRIAYWSPVAPYRIGEQNVALDSAQETVLAQSLATANLPFFPELVERNEVLAAVHPYHNQSHQEQGYNLAFKIFGHESNSTAWPDGIISSDDMLTHGALTSLQRLGIRVGADIKIATHANVGSPALLGWESDLTMIEVDPAEIVHRMFEMLECLMDGTGPGQTIYEVMPHPRKA